MAHLSHEALALLAAVQPVEVMAIGTLVSALAGTILALTRRKAETEGIFVSTAQGATTIQSNLIKTLYAELERRDKLHVQELEELRQFHSRRFDEAQLELARKDAYVEALERRVSILEEELDAPQR